MTFARESSPLNLQDDTAMDNTIKLKRIDAAEFEALADSTRMHQATREMARLVLVDGKTGTEVAAMYGKSKQFVGKAVKAIREAHAASTTSTAWVTLSLSIPESLNAPLQQFLEALRASHSVEANGLATAQVERALGRAAQLLSLADDSPAAN